ncbi:MAG: hypothetical protein ACYTEL_25865 [Planctomycetota bacterium]|jgi:hypothetical protein
MQGSRTGKAGLVSFAKKECANWLSERKCCVGTRDDKYFNDHGTCRIAEGKPCRYFEQSVLGPPDYKFRLPGYDYEALFRQYSKINPVYRGEQVVVRRCECGAELQPRRRFCNSCRQKREREANRNRQKRHYQKAFVST